MSLRPRLRRAAKWACTLVFLASVAGMVLNTSRFARCWWEHGSRTSTEIIGGQLEVWNVPVRPLLAADDDAHLHHWMKLHRAGWSVSANHPAIRTRWHWWFECFADRSGFMFSVPLWIPAAAAGFFSLRFWREDIRAALGRRKALKGLCHQCLYDRTGLSPEALCPECGAPPWHARSS